MGNLSKGFSPIFFAIIIFIGFTGWVVAGILEPPGPPAPTMKTLDQIPPTWDQILPGSERFVLVMGGEAVLDKETGLVWEQTTVADEKIYRSSVESCLALRKGGRMGWRLPQLEELLTLIDPSVPVVATTPRLPPGAPFEVVLDPTDQYWTTTTDVGDPSRSYTVDLTTGTTSYGNKNTTPDTFFRWCVRGGRGADFN